ncbi:hypothetical protein ACJX0J_000354 [Zea mays]
MAPYISAKRKGTHITNLARTARFLSEACDLVFDAASQGKSFLIVGTKKRAADLVASAAISGSAGIDAAILKRKLSTLQRYLGGIKYMTEYIALQECAIWGFLLFL